MMGDMPRKTDSKERMLRIMTKAANPPPDASAPISARLFGGTLEETARALFDHPRPVFAVDPDVTILIRKAWDVGVQRVSLQTVMQVDGDMLQVIGTMDTSERDFLMQVHKSAVKDGVAQWHALFDVVRQLGETVGKVMFRG